MKIPISFKNTLISYFWGYSTTIPNRRCGGAIPKEKAKLGREVASKQLTLRLCFIASEKIFKKCSKFQPSRESATGGTLPTVPGPETRQGRLRTLSPPLIFIIRKNIRDGNCCIISLNRFSWQNFLCTNDGCNKCTSCQCSDGGDLVRDGNKLYG